MLTMDNHTEAAPPGVDLAVIVEGHIARVPKITYGKRHLRQPPDASKAPLSALRYYLAGASLLEVAQTIGTDPCTMSRWERTGKGMKPERRAKIATLYGVPETLLEDLEWHLQGREKPEPSSRRPRGSTTTGKPERITKEMMARWAAELDRREDQLMAREKEFDKKTKEELGVHATKIFQQLVGVRCKLTGMLADVDRLMVAMQGIAGEINELGSPPTLSKVA